jgi:hypothetical protein
LEALSDAAVPRQIAFERLQFRSATSESGAVKTETNIDRSTGTLTARAERSQAWSRDVDLLAALLDPGSSEEKNF